MQARLDRALYLLQQLAYARILCEFHRLRQTRLGSDLSPPELAEAVRRVKACEQQLSATQLGLDDPAKAAAVRVARALYLRFLLNSAAARLQPWSDSDDLVQMPQSHMFEWIAHDFEQLELAALEDSMTAAEAALYARSLEGASG